MSWGKEIAPLDGHEHLTMADQMRAASIPSQPHTSPNNGSVTNPRREYLKNRIAQHKAAYQQPKSGSTTGSIIADDAT